MPDPFKNQFIATNPKSQHLDILDCVIGRQYGVILILFLFRFVAKIKDLLWDNFLVLTMNRRGVIRVYFPQAKTIPQAYTGVK